MSSLDDAGLAPQLRPETGAAIDAVARGLEMAAVGVGPTDIKSKGKLDIVTTMDVAVEKLIRSMISEASEVPVVGEEMGGEVAPSDSAYWLLDPICGTRNYASGIPLYSVNLALVEGDEVSLAVAGDPSTRKLHVAERMHGAWSLEAGSFRPLSVSARSETVIIEVGRAEGSQREAAARFTAEAIRADRWELRALSTTLSLPYLAAGRAAAYVLFQGSALHTAAGVLLAMEAGAVVTEVNGAPWTIRSTSIVAAATPELHAELLQLRN